MILEHEKVHSRQLHTLDILLANFATAFLWFNPLSWWYRKCVEQNLEFIADRETIKSTGNQKEYQYALLRVSQEGNFSGLLNHFHRSFIKSRIIMLKKGTTDKSHRWKHFLVLPALVFFLLGFNTEEEVIFSNKEEQTKVYSAIGQEPVFFIDSTTSDSYFRGMESYFRKNYPNLQIAFTGITRDADLALTGFQIETKFEGEKIFTKRMENLSEQELKPRFAVQYSPEKQALIIKEQFEKELQISITKEAIHASHIEQLVD
ncbi:M56 family metallopeptidase [Salinimicrobium sp. CAU 1759]